MCWGCPGVFPLVPEDPPKIQGTRTQPPHCRSACRVPCAKPPPESRSNLPMPFCVGVWAWRVWGPRVQGFGFAVWSLDSVGIRGQTRNLEPQTQNPGTPTPPDTSDPEARNTHPIAGRLLFFGPDGLDLGLLRWPPPPPVCSCRDRMLRSPSLELLILAVIRSRCTPGARPSHPGVALACRL